MRRIFLTIVAALAMSSNMFAQKYVMQVNMKDGSVLEYSVDDIDSVTFREAAEGDNDKIDERALINDYIQKNNVTVISKEQFEQNGCVTDVDKNEYVLFPNGLYMQIVREGCGTKSQDGETRQVSTRFTETNLSNGKVLSDTSAEFAYITEIFLAMKSNGAIVAQFQPGGGLMYTTYQSAAVPAGWTSALEYVKIGRIQGPEDELAKVRLIVPSALGQIDAMANGYP